MLEHLELEFLGLHSGYITNIDGCGVATRAVTSTSLLAPDPLMWGKESSHTSVDPLACSGDFEKPMKHNKTTVVVIW